VRQICQTFGIRPSDYLDPDHELLEPDRIFLDITVLTARSKLGQQTKSLRELQEYVERLQRKRGVPYI